MSAATNGAFRRVSDIAWRFLLIALAVYVVGNIVARLWLVALPFTLALFLTSVLRPAVAWMSDRGLPALAATWIVMLTGIAVVGGVLYVASNALYQNAEELGAAIADGWDKAVRFLDRSALGVSSEDLRNAVSGFTEDNGAAIARRVFSGALALIELLTVMVLTLFFTFFFLKDGERLFLGATSWVSEERREAVREGARRAWDNLSTFMRNQALIAVINSVQTAIVLILLDIPLVLPIAVLTFIASFIPFVGPVTAGVAGGLVALSNEGLATALVFVAIEFAYEQIEGNVIAPMILGKGLDLHPTVVAGSVTAGALVAGIPGAFLAVPLVSVFYTVLLYWRERTTERSTSDGDTTSDGDAGGGQ